MPQGVATTGTDVLATGRHLAQAGATVALCGATALALFPQIWQRNPLADLHRQPGGWTGAFCVVAASALVHELLHALGWMLLGRAPWGSVVVRPTMRVMGLVARLDHPIPVNAYRAGLALPALAMGAVPLLLGLVSGGGLWLTWGAFFSLECFSDLATLFATRCVSEGAHVLSHPGKLGCRIAEAPLREA